MKDSGKTTKSKEKANSDSKMEIPMKVVSSTISSKDSVKCTLLEQEHTRVHFMMETYKEKEDLNIQMVLCMKETGKVTKSMEQESQQNLMEQLSTKVNGRVIRNMGREFLSKREHAALREYGTME